MENIIERLKRQYEPLRRKYKLPSFEELNKEFEIEKIQEHETEYIIREARKCMGEKVGAFLRFLETILNPVMAPVFVLASLKNLSSRDKELVKTSYEILVELEIKAISLDIEYNEKAEAEFIRSSFNKWQDIKQNIKEIIDSISKAQIYNEDKKKSYLG